MDKNVLHFPLDDETRARLEAEGRAEVMQPQNEAGGVGDDARARAAGTTNVVPFPIDDSTAFRMRAASMRALRLSLFPGQFDRLIFNRQLPDQRKA